MTQKKWGSMERQLLERMIGAVVLLVALVLIVPAILDGSGDGDDAVSPSSVDSGRTSVVDDPPLMRRYERRLDQPPETPPLPQPTVANDEPAAQPAEKTGVKQSSPPAKPSQQAVPPASPQPAKSNKVARAPAPAPAKPKPAPKPKSLAAEKSGWVVQLGSFSNRANAQGLADRVKSKGFAAYLMPIERSGKTLYRVRVGPPQTSRDKAAKLSDDLRRAGYTGQVTEQVAGR